MNQILFQDILNLIDSDKDTDLLENLVRALQQTADADYCFVADIDSKLGQANTSTLYSRAGKMENFSYSLKGTPCADVLGESVCVHPQNIQNTYPEDQLLIDMGINSYVGTPLRNSRGENFGILVALFERELSNAAEIEALFKLYAGLIARDFDQRLSTQKLKLAQKALDFANDGIIITDKEKTIIYCNESHCRNTGYSKDELIGSTPALLKSDNNSPELYQDMWQTISKQGYWRGELINRMKDGREKPYAVTISEIKDEKGACTHYTGILSDISERKQQEAKILYQATHDLLTGLHNRHIGSEKLQELVSISKRYSRTFSVILFDLDHFKDINDQHGHQIGDEVLQSIAGIVVQNIRTSDLACRWGGEEFLIICQETDEESALLLAEKLRQEIEDAELSLNIKMTASFGVSSFRTYETENSMMLRADDYLYQAKEEGRNIVISNRLAEQQKSP